jgi:hypothetical protein
MRITVTIPEELAAQVEARGFTLETYMRELLESAVGTTSTQPRSSSSARDMASFFEAMAADSGKIPQLPDEAFTRKSFYQDHD